MRYRLDEAKKSAVRPDLRPIVVTVLLALTAGCASNIEEGVGPPRNVPSLSGSGPKDTGTYPNLNIQPETAAPQMTEDQRLANAARLKGAGNAAQANATVQPMSAAEQARLKKLAEDQGKSVLAEIEGQ